MEANTPMELWVKEKHKDILEMGFKVEKTLFSRKSPYQQIDVVKTCGHGAMLLNDGIIMLSERDEFVYHEMIAHVPLFVHPVAKSVLVIGGGDGGTVREVLKHREIERVVMVEIDKVVVEACRKFMPSVSSAMDDPRLELIIDDGIKYIAETIERFDVVIVDSSDPTGPAVGLFNEAFYKGVAGILTSRGIMITQAESPFYDHDLQQPMFLNQRPFFKKLHMYLFSNLTYPGGLWSFGFASKGLCPLNDFNPERFENSGISTRYYNPRIHRAAFVLPTFLEESLSEVLDPLAW